MKSQETSIQNHQNVQSSNLNFDFHSLECSKGNPSVMLCQNKNCANVSFICSGKDCQCQLNHKKCMKTFSEEFFNEINKKIKPTTDIKSRINTIFDEAIDYISKVRDEIEVNLKYLGLNHDEKQLMKLMDQKEFDSVSGAKVWKVCQTIYEQKQFSTVQISKEISKFWRYNQSKFKKNFDKLKNLAQKQTEHVKIFGDSSIVQNPSDSDVICNFFDEFIFKTKLLYSAKKSKYNLLTYQISCTDNKNTLLIVKGKQGKVFGFFMDKALPPSVGNLLGANCIQPSQKSFMFSLTNKDKINLTNKNNYFSYTPLTEINFGRGLLVIYRNQPVKYKKDQRLINQPLQLAQQPTGMGFGGGGFGNLGGFGGFGNQGFGNQGFGNQGGLDAFGQFRGLNEKQNEETQHYCVVLQGSAFNNQKYRSDDQSCIMLAGTSEKVFTIQQWEVHQLIFEDDSK